ncbi:MAG: hypothetical protein U1F49_05685 [Rubrivivax sp.]
MPTTDLLEDRGMMGDGVIDPLRLRGWVAIGFAGYSEVEIFSKANWWQREGGEVLDTCIERHRRCVQGQARSKPCSQRGCVPLSRRCGRSSAVAPAANRGEPARASP